MIYNILPVLLAVLASPEPGRTDSAEVVNLEPIVVTARRRQESNQDVPISITTFSNDSLREQHITSNEDLLARVPSLARGTYGGTRSTQAFVIRGEGATYQGAQGVVEYLAETPLPSGVAYSTQGDPGQYLDLARVEVLRGPQGTLFGRNATGGAVLLEPARPESLFGGYLEGQIGNYQDREVEGVVNTPLRNEALLVRAAFRIVDRAGFTKNLVGAADDSDDYWTGRIGIDYKPSDMLENYFLAYKTDQNDRGTGFVIGAVNSAFGFSSLQRFVDAQIARGPRVVEDPDDSHDIVRTAGLIDMFAFKVNDVLTFRNIASYSLLKRSERYNFDGLGVLPNIINIAVYTNDPDQYQDNYQQFTEEIQAQGVGRAGHLQWTAGAYADRSTPDGPNQSQSQGIGLGVLQEDQQYGITHRSTAVYFQGGYDGGEIGASLAPLTLTAGLRYTWDSTDGFQDTTITHTSAPALAVCNANPMLTRPNCRLAAEVDSNAPNWLIGLDYRFSPEVLAYAKVSEGYKTGGFNPTAVNQ